LAETCSICSVETFRAGDGYRWHYRRYPAAGTARAHVVMLHGIQSHGGWYGYSCNRLSEAGFEVSFLDRRGSGLNTEDRGDAPSFRRLLDDVAEYLRPLRASGAPVFLAAISWGGKVAVALQRRHPSLVDGLALLCPGIFPRIRPPFRQRCAIAAVRLVRPRQLFPIPLSDPELFTATPRWLQFLREDPLSLHRATARFLIESVRLDGYLRFAARAVRVPVLLLLAERDRIINNARTRQFVERLPAADKQIIEYPGAHHTLEFEPDPDRFVADLRGWLERQAEAPLAKTSPAS
jgi:alpha-beta hydrolase superfamily lysophospholipase